MMEKIQPAKNISPSLAFLPESALRKILTGSVLFQGIPEEDLPLLLKLLHNRRGTYKKGHFLLHAGDRVSAIGMILKGSVMIVKYDFWGNENLMGRLGAGSIFAESFACSPDIPLNVSVTAAAPCEVLWLDSRFLLTGEASHPVQQIFLHNLIRELAHKNLQFNEKMTHMGQRSIREKLLSYLSAAATRNGSPSFSVPLNRQQMADYLCVDRSALSAVLSSLRAEGVLTFEKNHFHLYKMPLP